MQSRYFLYFAFFLFFLFAREPYPFSSLLHSWIVGLASALGTKVALEKNNLVGRIKLFGTPAEETTGGKIDMINKGAFEGLDACMMSHPAPADVVYCTILSVGGMTVEYFGKASHASASPWEGKIRK